MVLLKANCFKIGIYPSTSVIFLGVSAVREHLAECWCPLSCPHFPSFFCPCIRARAAGVTLFPWVTGGRAWSPLARHGGKGWGAASRCGALSTRELTLGLLCVLIFSFRAGSQTPCMSVGGFMGLKQGHSSGSWLGRAQNFWVGSDRQV